MCVDAPIRDSLPGRPAPCPAQRPCRLLLILGPPASGKTQLAEQLAARYDALALRKDEIKEILFDTLGWAGPAGFVPPSVIAAGHSVQSGGAWSRALSDASFALLFALAQRLRQPGRALLLEGNFRPGEHEPAVATLLAGVERQLAGRGEQLAQVLCHARPETLIARLTARANDPTRHPGHGDLPTAAQLRRTAPAAGFLDLPGPRLRFDSEATPDNELSSLYSVLDPWMHLATP